MNNRTPTNTNTNTGHGSDISEDKLIAMAPEMYAVLKAIVDGGSWHDDGSFVYYPPTDDERDTGAIGEAEDIVSSLDHPK